MTASAEDLRTAYGALFADGDAEFDALVEFLRANRDDLVAHSLVSVLTDGDGVEVGMTFPRFL